MMFSVHLGILNAIAEYIMSAVTFLMILAEGVIDFAIVTVFLAGSAVADGCRMLEHNKEICQSAVKILVPILLVAAVIFRERLYSMYKGKIEEKLSEVIEVVSPAPVRRLNRKWSDECDSEGYDDDLTLSDDISTMDYSNEALEWDTKERKNILALLSSAEIVERSVADPRVLVGWRIAINEGRDICVVVSTEKKRFTTTRFTVEMADGQTRKLKLKRSATKGIEPFVLLEKVF